MKQIWQKQNKTQIAPNWVRDTEILTPKPHNWRGS